MSEYNALLLTISFFLIVILVVFFDKSNKD